MDGFAGTRGVVETWSWGQFHRPATRPVINCLPDFARPPRRRQFLIAIENLVDETMATKPPAADRETLYREVRTWPVTDVPPRYARSDVGLVRICRKIAIPVPSQAHWDSMCA